MGLDHPFIIFIFVLAGIKLALSAPALLRADSTGTDVMKASARSSLEILRPRYLLIAGAIAFVLSAMLHGLPPF